MQNFDLSLCLYWVLLALHPTGSQHTWPRWQALCGFFPKLWLHLPRKSVTQYGQDTVILVIQFCKTSCLSSQDHKAREAYGPGNRFANIPLHIESICLELQVLEKQPITRSLSLLCSRLLSSKYSASITGFMEEWLGWMFVLRFRDGYN